MSATWSVTTITATVRVAAAICAFTFAAFCAITLLQVLNRYLIGSELYWTEEVVILLFVWSVMMGLPVALWSHNEIVVDLLQLQPGLLKRCLMAFTELLSIAFLVTLSWSGLQLMGRAGHALSPALELPRWIFYASIPVGSALSVLVIFGRWWLNAENTTTLDKDYVVNAHD